jgi:Protein of unknown function DUF262
MKHDPPKPNSLAVSWFFGEHKKGTLIPQPKYQRNPIWSIGQKCFLIDSLMTRCPIPQVFINIKTEGKGSEKTTIYEVVDGQQRLRTILEFLNEEWPLVSTAAKAYPVSEEYKPHIGKKYSELPDQLQNAIWDYPMAVQEIRGWDDFDIRAMFRRLNYVNERLNPQELRHSQYFGEFNEAVEELAKSEFWDDIGLFTRRDSQRMKDVEFVSELFVVVIDGIQDQQKTLDKFYADYDVIFPKKNRYIARFNEAVNSLQTISPIIAQTRFSKKADFYALFAAILEKNEQEGFSVDLSDHSNRLKNISRIMEQDPNNLKGWYRTYYSSVIEGANKLAKRKQRRDLLLEQLS